MYLVIFQKVCGTTAMRFVDTVSVIYYPILFDVMQYLVDKPSSAASLSKENVRFCVDTSY